MCMYLQIYLCSACIYKATICSRVFLEELVCLGADDSVSPYPVMSSKQLNQCALHVGGELVQALSLCVCVCATS